MNEPERTEWQIRCAFNGFCKRTLKNERINAHKEIRKRQAHEISFSDLTPKEENQLYTCEDFFAENKEEQTFFAGGIFQSGGLKGKRCFTTSLLPFKAKTQADLRKNVSISRYTKCRKCLKRQAISTYKNF